MGTIRVSAANLARIELEGKLLVGLNKGALKAGKHIYTPFGGALEFHEPARPFLESLEAVFEKGNDLRFVMPEKKLPLFEEWFYQRRQRETSPYRELEEELVNEEQALPELPCDAVTLDYLATTSS